MSLVKRTEGGIALQDVAANGGRAGGTGAILDVVETPAADSFALPLGVDREPIEIERRRVGLRPGRRRVRRDRGKAQRVRRDERSSVFDDVHLTIGNVSPDALESVCRCPVQEALTRERFSCLGEERLDRIGITVDGAPRTESERTNTLGADATNSPRKSENQKPGYGFDESF